MTVVPVTSPLAGWQGKERPGNWKRELNVTSGPQDVPYLLKSRYTVRGYCEACGLWAAGSRSCFFVVVRFCLFCSVLTKLHLHMEAKFNV